MSTPLIIVDYDLDVQRMKEIAEEAYPSATFYSDDRFPDADFSWWKIGKYEHPALQKIADDFGIECNARFYWQDPHSYLPPHVDNGTQCSLNFVLSDDPAPVTIEDTDYYYKAAFLNTTLMHSVKTGDTPRLLLKFSIFNQSIEDIGYKYKYGKTKQTTIRAIS
jgi:hypothetical protein